MADERISLSKLSQLSPSGKMRDPLKIPVGKELPRKKKGKRNSSVPAEAGTGREEDREEDGSAVPSGRVVDILI